jgi:hypothetical protein
MKFVKNNSVCDNYAQELFISSSKHYIRPHGQVIWSLFDLDAAELLCILRYLVEFKMEEWLPQELK